MVVVETMNKRKEAGCNQSKSNPTGIVINVSLLSTSTPRGVGLLPKTLVWCSKVKSGTWSHHEVTHSCKRGKLIHWRQFRFLEQTEL
ncbi:hypothetical protein Ocin01_06560 [Orchesella cincta]|uniref:Uncharacterized protein n=1 Tax=Orchesella cincta TaxID=48709 RepID=A0A1D2N4G4_ORCCI|nr:hypothetical protein Ocin01_06560 [Orchesella cincta]